MRGDSPWCAVSKRAHVEIHHSHGECEHDKDHRSPKPKIRLHGIHEALQQRPSDRYGVVDCLGENKVQDGASNKGRGEMRWQVVMNEKLTVHEEEWEVVHGPYNDEEPGIVPQAVADSC